VDNLGSPIFVPAPPSVFPAPFPSNPAPGSEAITWGLDSGIKSPFSYAIDLSVQRQLSSNFTLDVAYVGRLSHRLLAQSDLAMPLDPFDKKAGIDYFTAAMALAKLYRSGLTTNQFNPSMVPRLPGQRRQRRPVSHQLSTRGQRQQNRTGVDRCLLQRSRQRPERHFQQYGS
jgi:hypothetical protein